MAVALVKRDAMAGVAPACCRFEDAAGCVEIGCNGKFSFEMLAVFRRTGSDSRPRQRKVAGRELKRMRGRNAP